MKIFDLHNDALVMGGKTASYDIIYAIWTTELSKSQAIKLIDRHSGKMLAIEDAGVFGCELPSYAFKYVGLTWNKNNRLAGGAFGDGKLTGEGRRLIDILNERKIPLDTAHLNRESFFEAAERADKIICSHTCFDEVNRHLRNLTREQISVIINKGGLIGLCFVGDFLGGKTLGYLIRHIDWFLSVFGDRNLAIGSDFNGTSDLPYELNSYAEFDRLVVAMIRAGYSDATIKRILHDNAAAYFAREEPL